MFSEKDLQAQNYKIKKSNINTFPTSSSPPLNDRLRKRRCFADKELDHIPVLSSVVETRMTNSAFRMINLSHLRSNNYHREASDKTKSNQKKCTDFSVAAIIGRS